MFVKKLVEKATKKPGENQDCLKPEDVDPRLAFHYGLPSSAAMFAYDPVQKILAISTKNGQIKLLGKDNAQALLESNDMQPSKFLQFFHNQGILLNVTVKDQIEVWDVDKKILSHVHDFSEKITSFSVLQQGFIFTGDRAGNVTVWKLDKDFCQIEKMKYWIPFSESHGYTNNDPAYNAVMYILPQPTAESKRILIIFADGLVTLWAIPESKALFTIGGSGTMTNQSSQETKRVTSACWVCPIGSKVAVGYDTGDILIYSILSNSDIGSGSPVSRDSGNSQTVKTSKINLGYRLEKIPIVSLKWVYIDEKANRLYVIGASDATSTNLVQVILLNEDTESRTVKVGLPLPEPCLDLEIISSANEQSKHKQEFLLLLGKSGLMYAYDDHSIEKCLLQSQSKSSASLPNELIIKLPISASSITSAQFITNYSNKIDSEEEEYMLVAKKFPSILPSEAKHTNSPHFVGFAKIRNLYITGHSDGTIKFWDVSCPLLIPLLSLIQQNEDDSSQSGIAVTAIHYCSALRLLFSGDKSGMVRIYQFKPEPFSIENGLFSLPGSSKKGNSHVIHSVKFIKVSGSVLSFHIYNSSRYLAVGSEQGHISVIDIEGSSILYQKKIGTELSPDVISLKFELSDLQGFEKNILVIATRDSSLLALDADTGNTLSSSAVHPKIPSKALFMQTLDASRESSTEAAAQKQQLLLCSEKAVYVYSLPHIVQGVKKVLYKKKFHSSSCCWASTICSSSRKGLVLLFSCGKVEIRFLPELSLVKETTIRSLTCSPSKPNTLLDYSLCSSADGEVIMIRSDQEVAVASMLPQNGKYKNLDSLSRVYDTNLSTLEDGATSSVYQKEKKKGVFGTLFKDVTGSKSNLRADAEATDGKAMSEALSKNFAVANFPTQEEGSANVAVEKDDADLDIDDIDLDDKDEKPKANNVMGMLNKQKISSKFQSFKGKLKQMTVKNEKPLTNEEPQPENSETVDQIKKKYGFSSSSPSNEPVGVAKMLENKLTENVKKLQGISLRTTEMQDNAQTFSSMAKETLRLAEQKNSPSKT